MTECITSGAVIMDGTKCWDATDGDGHGILIVSPNIFVRMSSVSTGTTNSAAWKILYRVKYISQVELFGLLSQQTQSIVL